MLIFCCRRVPDAMAAVLACLGGETLVPLGGVGVGVEGAGSSLGRGSMPGMLMSLSLRKVLEALLLRPASCFGMDCKRFSIGLLCMLNRSKLGGRAGVPIDIGNKTNC